MKAKKEKYIITDIDDVVDDFKGDLCKAHNFDHGTCIVESDITSWGWEGLEFKDARGNIVTGKDLQETFSKYDFDGFYAAISLLEDSKFAIDTMKSIGYKIIALTARPDRYRKSTEYHFMKKDIKFDEIIFDWDKVKVINQLSETKKIVLFADDKLSTINAVQKNCKVDNVCLVTRGHNINGIIEDEDIKRVKSLFECVRYLKKVNK